MFTWKRINWTVGWEERKGLESSQSGKGWVAFGLRRPCCEVESGEISIGGQKNVDVVGSGEISFSSR